MARDYAAVNVSIWGDPAFRTLPPQAQHLYFALWTAPGLTYCGTHDWRPARLSGLADGWHRDDIAAAADCLAARRFLVVDPDTEEVLIRSWIKWDGLLKQPKLAVSCMLAYSEVASPVLRAVIVHEITEIREKDPKAPGWACWRDSRMVEILSHPAVDARTLAAPADPFTPGVTHRFTHSVTPGVTPGIQVAEGSAYPWANPRATPAPAPAPAPEHPDVPDADASETPQPNSRRRPERPLPQDWQPTEKHRAQAAEKGADLDYETRRFRNHAEEHDRRARNWDAAFRNWLDKAYPAQASIRPTPTRPTHEPRSLWDIVPNVTDERLAREAAEEAAQ